MLKREPDATHARGFCWRYVVCGTGCTEMVGFSYQGKVFGEGLPPDAVARRQAEFDRVCAGEGPLFSQTELPVPGRDFVGVYRGVFPFATVAVTVDRLFVVIADIGLRLR